MLLHFPTPMAFFYLIAIRFNEENNKKYNKQK